MYDPLNLAGTTLSHKYRVEAAVGSGGFAVVYKAVHTIWQQPVAIKFFTGLSAAPPEQREELKASFIREGALLTELSSQSPNIVQARDVGTYTTEDGRWIPYMVLEWLSGESLETLIERLRREKGRLSVEQTLSLLAPVAEALDLAHRRGIVHRDIKPANLFLTGPLGDPETSVKVLDFGVAKVVAQNTDVQAALAKTGTQLTSFTPQYGAPEQFSRGYGATGPWTDVFALALVGTELMTGREPMEGTDVVQLAFASSNPACRPTPLTLGAEISEALDAVFRKALAVEPGARFVRAGEFWEAVTRAASDNSPHGNTRSLGAPVPSAESGLPDTANISTKTQEYAPARKRRYGAIAITATAALAAGAVFFLWFAPGNSAPGNRQGEPPAVLSPTAPPLPEAPVQPPCPEGMARIPAGQFFMGSDEPDAVPMEKPSHNVALNAYCIDTHEVTLMDYQACSDKGQCRRAPRHVDWPNITEAQKETYGPACNANHPEGRKNHPVNCVDWQMADTYCNQTGKRLPTEAEWEFATRGPDGRIYPWGDEPPTHKHLNACGAECVAWAREREEELGALYEADDGFATTAPVGSFPLGKSKFGPEDVAGNVFEWVADWGAPYTSDSQRNPKGPATGERKIVRGGGWNGAHQNWLRPSFRFAADPQMKSHGFGFRCASDIPPPD